MHKRKNGIVILTGLLVITISNILGHFFPPVSIMATPIVLLFIVAGINYPLYQTSYLKTVIYNFGLILINDLLVRFYAGGAHDDAGKGWISLFSIFAFILSIAAMVVYIFIVSSTEQNRSGKLPIVTNFVLLIAFSATTAIIYSQMMDL